MAYDVGWLPSLKNTKEPRALFVHLPGRKKEAVEKLLRTYMVHLFEELKVERNDSINAELTIATFEDLDESPLADLGEEGFQIETSDNHTTIKGETERGLVYGIFYLMKQLQLGNKLHTIDVFERPASPIRMINHWDNMDGTVERGYAGRSLFFEDNAFIYDEKRITAYAELLASVGINALTMNNVNVHEVETYLIDESLLPDVAKHAAIFKKYGISLYLSINYASPIVLGKLDSADPLDKAVISWWKKQAEIIYRHVPELGGFVVKADSEHRPGPFTYGRTHADGANMLQKRLNHLEELFSGVVSFMTVCKTGEIVQPIERERHMIISLNWMVNSRKMSSYKSKVGQWISKCENRLHHCLAH